MGDAETVPDSGWGSDIMDKSFESDLTCGNFPFLRLWKTTDSVIVGLTEEERFAARNNPQKLPEWMRVYSLANVHESNLRDPTWKPIPYHILDDACMVIVMGLCKSGKKLGDCWPWNFDASGEPLETRLPFGPAVVCHYGTYNENGNQQGMPVSLLTYKRHHIFGGMMSNSLILPGGIKQDRMQLSITDSSAWSHGLARPELCTKRIGFCQEAYLRFYLAKDGRSKIFPWDHKIFTTSRDGVWFRRMHNHSEVPVLLNPTDNDPVANPEGHHTQNSILPVLEAADDSATETQARESISAAMFNVESIARSASPAQSVPVPDDTTPLATSQAGTFTQRGSPLNETGSVVSVGYTEAKSRAPALTDGTSRISSPRPAVDRAADTDLFVTGSKKRLTPTNFAHQTATKRQKTDITVGAATAEIYPPKGWATVYMDWSKLKDLKQNQIRLQKWFAEFNDNYPSIGYVGELIAIVIHTSLAPWKATSSGQKSMVEKYQARAREGYDELLTEIKTLCAEITSASSLHLRPWQILVSKMKALMRFSRLNPRPLISEVSSQVSQR